MAKRSTTTPRAPQQRHTHLVRSDEPVRVTVEPLAAENATWFRLFRSLVHGGVWAELTPAAAKVLIVLAECVNDNRRRETGQWVAWPSVATIAQRSGCQRRAVQKALTLLEERGLIARCRRRNARRGDYSNEYELHPPAETHAAHPPAHEDAHGGVSLDAPAPASHRTPVRRTPVRTASAPGNAQQRQTGPEIDQTSPATRALVAAGVTQPTLGRLLQDHDAQQVLLHVEDWQTRRKLGQQLGPAWLIASIRDGYELHEKTTAAIARRERSEQARRRRAEDAAAASSASEATRRLEAEADALFEAMSDEELDHWKQMVLEQLPAVTRGLHRADPRENARLRRLILGKLAHLVS